MRRIRPWNCTLSGALDELRGSIIRNLWRRASFAFARATDTLPRAYFDNCIRSLPLSHHYMCTPCRLPYFAPFPPPPRPPSPVPPPACACHIVFCVFFTSPVSSLDDDRRMRGAILPQESPPRDPYPRQALNYHHASSHGPIRGRRVQVQKPTVASLEYGPISEIRGCRRGGGTG